MQSENEVRNDKPADEPYVFDGDQTWRTPNDDPDATWPTARRATREEPIRAT